MHSSQPNWLAFSLSNEPSASSNLCLLEAFNTNHGRVEEDVSTDSGGGAGLKFEDFLGGCGSSAASSIGRFSAAGSVTDSDSSMYDSELKSIAAGFLRGYAAEQPDSEKTVLPSETKKVVDTFGQRTSIYRGVTRGVSVISGIGGREDTKLICGTTAAEEKGRVERAGKVVMTRKRKLQEHMISRHSNTGVRPPPPIFR
ncbi:hypothetical protein ACLOJK_030673 [Asimina triloba]